MGSVKLRKKKRKTSRKKLKKDLKHVAKILSMYKVLPEVKKVGDSESVESSDSENNFKAAETDLPKQLDWASFAKVREKLFGNLQNMIKENWNQNSSVKLTGNEIQDLSLQFEQRALLACMRSDVYQLAITDIITGLKEATAMKQLHPQVEKLIMKVWQRQNGPSVKKEPHIGKTVESSEVVAASKIETQGNNIPPSQEDAPMVEIGFEPPPLVPPSENPVTSDIGSVLVQTTENEVVTTLAEEKTQVFESCDVDDVTSTTNDNILLPIPAKDDEKEDQDNHDPEIDNLMRILEGSDEECNEEYSEETRCDLDTRLKLMQGIFMANKSAPEEESSSKHFGNDLSGKHAPKMWSIERYIFMYRISASMTRLNTTSYKNVRKKLINLFGNDSDDENEEMFCDYEKFTTNCVRRILPTVARYLMPYYKKRRICGGSFVFKNLVKRIAQSLIDQNYYPNDWEIQEFVERFFPDDVRYMDAGDVWSFTLDY